MRASTMTWAQLMEQRQIEARRHETEALAWSRRVTEQLAAEYSAFLKDFDETEARILGLIP